MERKMMRLLKKPQDRRRHRRINTRMEGRYMLGDRREYPCTIIDVSLGGLALNGPKIGSPGESVIIYAEELGRLLGNITRTYENGFAVELNLTGIAADRFENRLYELESPRGLANRLRFWQR